jgi:ABC-type thiamin/hydroxymethylpyrimidine transport system permease subunit
VAGAVIMVAVLVVVFPVVFLMSGAIAAAILGTLLKQDAEQTHQGSELLDLNT